MESGHVPLSLDWPFITIIPLRQTCGADTVPGACSCAGGRASNDNLRVMYADDQDGTWAAPAAAGPVRARIWLPASKSITNRALVLAALSDRPARIANPLRARDTLLAAGALRGVGAEVADDAQGSPAAWRVTAGQPSAGSRVSVDVGNAGTVIRF